MDKTHFSGSYLQILGILLHFTLGGFSLYVSFSKTAAQVFGDLWIHSTAPGNEYSKTDVPRFEISQGKFGGWRLFRPSKFDPATGVINLDMTLFGGKIFESAHFLIKPNGSANLLGEGKHESTNWWGLKTGALFKKGSYRHTFWGK